MVFVACVVNQLRVMSSILRYRGFTNLIYLVSADRQRTNFPMNASEAYNAHDSFAVSAMKERDVPGCGPSSPYAFFQSCTNGAFLRFKRFL